MNFERVTFENSSGEKLAGRLDPGTLDTTRAYAILAHCFTCTKNFKAVANISRALTRTGIAVMRFDFSGLGESEGDFSDTNFSSNVSDLVAAARFLERRYEAPKLLIGHSFGGTACLQAAMKIPSAEAVVTIASPAEPRHVERHLAHAMEQIKQKGEAQLHLAGKSIRIKKQFIEDIQNVEIAEILPQLSRALLILHSPADEVVSIENAAHLFKAAKHPKSFVSLDNADHMLSAVKDSEYAGAVIAAWSGRYIG